MSPTLASLHWQVAAPGRNSRPTTHAEPRGQERGCQQSEKLLEVLLSVPGAGPHAASGKEGTLSPFPGWEARP